MPARSGSARRYADALFGIAVERDTIDAWGNELLRLAQQVARPGAARVLETPSAPLAAKRAALEGLAGPLSPEVRFVVNLLLERRRVELLPQLAEAFDDRIRQHRGIALAEVATAVQLADAERQLVAQRLEQYLGQRVEITTRVDPSLIGGVVARVGDQLLDASVRGQLELLRKRLKAGADPLDGGDPDQTLRPGH